MERVQALGAPPIVGLSVLSCFDGIGCVAQALQQAGVPVARYEAVDNDAEDAGIAAMAEHMNPATERFAGISRSLPQDINRITEAHIAALGRIDLIIGGPPCKDLSRARLQRDFRGRKGKPGEGFRGKTGYLFPLFVKVVGWVRKHNARLRSQ